MDWLRTTYSCPARFHDDPDAPLVTLRWMWTDQEFQQNESAINSKHWADAGERETVVGEQWTFPPPTRALDLPIGVTNGHQCGEVSDFEDGQPWSIEGGPVAYDEDDMPVCCPRYHGLTVPPRPVADVSVGTPDPVGVSCCDADPALIGVEYVQPFRPFAGTPDWWRWELPAGNYRVTLGFIFPMLVNGGVATGPDCGHMTLVWGSIGAGSHTSDVSLIAPATLCVDIFCLVGNPATDSYTLQVDPI